MKWNKEGVRNIGEGMAAGALMGGAVGATTPASAALGVVAGGVLGAGAGVVNSAIVARKNRRAERASHAQDAFNQARK